MEVAGEYTFDAPQNLVWDALKDPNVLGLIVPGGQGFAEVGENQYTAALMIKVGPINGTFQGEIKLSDIVAPTSYNIAVDGKGAPGFVKAMGSLRLEPRDEQTFMAYNGDAQIGGKIASVGQRLIDASARSIIRQSLDALNEYLKAKAQEQIPVVVAAVAEPAVSSPQAAALKENAPDATMADIPAIPAQQTVTSPAPTPPTLPSNYKPPSQMSLAMNVARDVLNDFVPVKYQPILVGVVTLVILLIVWMLVSR